MTALGSFFAPEILPECVSFHGSQKETSEIEDDSAI